MRLRLRESRGEDDLYEIDMEKAARPFSPLATLSEKGALVWNEDVANAIAAASTPPKKNSKARRGT